MTKICLLLSGLRSGLLDALKRQSNINPFNQKTEAGEGHNEHSSTSAAAAVSLLRQNDDTHHRVKTTC